jgi:hypothetical protein
MTTEALGDTGVPGDGRQRQWAQGCFRYFAYIVSWLILYICTVYPVAEIVTKRLLTRQNQEGYGAYLLVNLVVMPIGLILSGAVLAVTRRVWVFLLLAVLLAAATALAPVFFAR